jgi:hypothetical protein
MHFGVCGKEKNQSRRYFEIEKKLLFLKSPFLPETGPISGKTYFFPILQIHLFPQTYLQDREDNVFWERVDKSYPI